MLSLELSPSQTGQDLVLLPYRWGAGKLFCVNDIKTED